MSAQLLPRYEAVPVSSGWYVWDREADCPTGDEYGTQAEADMRAFTLNSEDRTRTGCVDLILKERARQNEKWGPQDDLPSGTWLAVLTKEVGDVSRSLLHPRRPTEKELEVELVHVAATALAWLEVLDRRR